MKNLVNNLSELHQNGAAFIFLLGITIGTIAALVIMIFGKGGKNEK
jgi:hypothetical protein